MLSPCVRQVAHALLTRPPLRRISALLLPCAPVRLACVKHAASVHPEPGSNSRIFDLSPSLNLVFLFPLYCFLGRLFVFLLPLNLLLLSSSSRIFRAALLFICQGASPSRFFPRWNFIILRFPFFVNNFLTLFCHIFVNRERAKKRNLNRSRFFFFYMADGTEKEGFEPSRRVNDLHP